MKSIAQEVRLVDKCRVYSNGRKEVHYYILEAPSEEEARKWIEENVFFQPYIKRLVKRNKRYTAEVESWVD
jgi:hypothetical protein